MNRPLLIACAAVVGCTDNGFDVQITIAESERAQVTQLELQLLEVPMGEDVCDGLAFGQFGQIGGETPIIDSLTSFSTVFGPNDDVEIPDVRRTGSRAFLITAIRSEELHYAGCTQVEGLASDQQVQVELQPIVEISISNVDAGLPRAGDVNDLEGRPVSGVPVRFVSSSIPAESFQQETDGDGRFSFSPTASLRPGPLRASIRARWASQPVQVSAFTPPAVTGWTGAAQAVAATNNTLSAITTSQGAVSLSTCRGAGTAFSCESEVDVPSAANSNQWSLVRVDSATHVAINESEWWTVAGTGPAVAGTPPAAAFVAAGAVGPCTGQAEVLLQYEDNPSEIRDATSNMRPPLFEEGLDLVASGCLSNGRRVAAVSNAIDELFLTDLTSGRSDFLSVRAVLPGAFFTAPTSDFPDVFAQAEPALGFDIVAAYRLDSEEDGLERESLISSAVSTRPVSVAAGDLDGDGELDLAAILSDDDPDLYEPAYFLWVALSRTFEGTPIAAQTALDVSFCEASLPRLMLSDLDADGDADIVLWSPPGEECAEGRLFATSLSP